VVTVNREEARPMLSVSDEQKGPGMMTEWGESSSGAAVGSDGTVDTAAYV
jgi:hypothetical protein